jgi:clan AA aspartic protease (TIGR02281 family)
MKGIIVLGMALLLLAAAKVHSARFSQAISAAAAQTEPAEKQFRLAQGELPAVDRSVPLPAVQLPTIDRPGHAASHDIVTTGRTQGHFFFQTEVNGTTMPMMFDTGARWVALRAEDAERAGIRLSSLNYSMRTMTANGVGSAAPVVIKVMKVGNITRTNVPAVVMKPGSLAFNLLGQSFMSTMAGFSTDGDRLTLRGN